MEKTVQRIGPYTFDWTSKIPSCIVHTVIFKVKVTAKVKVLSLPLGIYVKPIVQNLLNFFICQTDFIIIQVFTVWCKYSIHTLRQTSFGHKSFGYRQLLFFGTLGPQAPKHQVPSSLNPPISKSPIPYIAN